MGPMNVLPEYVVQQVAAGPGLEAAWDAPVWAGARIVEVKQFRPESSGHRPRTFVRLVHSQVGLHGIFLVHDRYVRCVRTNYFDDVWKDSCVEFFAQPRPEL